mgnify:CR=1 FL=1|jgi:hypothetical protein
MFDLLNTDANVTIAIKKNDLFELFQKFQSEKMELDKALHKAESTEVYLSPAEVSKMIGVDLSTLWRWEKTGYLYGYRIGGKKRYKKSDITKIMEG